MSETYYELDLGGTTKYYLSTGSDAVGITEASDGMFSTAGTNASIMDEVSDADEVSKSEVPDEAVEQLERARDNLL